MRVRLVDDTRAEVGEDVRVGVVECQLYSTRISYLVRISHRTLLVDFTSSTLVPEVLLCITLSTLINSD